MTIASTTEGVDELVGVLDRPREMLPRDLEPRDVIVVTDTKPMKSKMPHCTFGCRDLAQFLNRYRIAIRKSGRQAGHGRLVPGAQPEELGERTDLGFG
jgi:hypothetical protein